MIEMAPVPLPGPVPGTTEKPPAKKRGKKPVGLTSASRKAPNFSVSKLITESLSVTQGRAGMSLIALKKALAAAGYDVEKKNSRVKLALKRLVRKGVLVQTKGTGASGSFKLSKKAAPVSGQRKVRNPASAKTKKPRATPKKTPGSARKGKRAKSVQQRKTPVKARARKPKAEKPKLTLQKANPRKTASKK